MLSLLSSLLFMVAADGEWPQWMGPTRNNVWHETGVLAKFPPGGPKVLWRAPVHLGYAGPAVASGKVVVMDYITRQSTDEGNFNRKEISGTERVLCFDQRSGERLWVHEYPANYSISYPYGPRCTPVVDGNAVYALGAMGDLTCLDIQSGRVIWSRQLAKEYGAKPALWGYAAHPVIDGQKLFTLAGVNGCHVVALDKGTGQEIWRAGSQSEQGYCPVQFAEVGGVRQLIVAGPNAIRGLNPETGERYWSQDYDATSGSIIMTPVLCGPYLFIGGYQRKNLLLKLGIADGKPTAEKVWRDEKNLGISPVNVQPFLEEDVLYGYNEDGTLLAVELPSGKRLWTSTGPVGGEEPVSSGTAFLVKNGDRFFSFAETGELVICKLSRQGYQEIDRAKLLDPLGKAFGRKVVWCMPAFADRKMFVRNDQELICVDLSQ